LLPLLLTWLVLVRFKDGLPWKRLVLRSVAFFVLGLLPWTARNYWAMDGFVPIKSNFGLELWLGNNPGVQHIYTPELHPWLNLNQELALIMMGEINFSRFKRQEAIDFIKSHPRTFLRLSAERFVDTWTSHFEAPTDPWLKVLRAQRKFVIFSAAL